MRNRTQNLVLVLGSVAAVALAFGIFLVAKPWLGMSMQSRGLEAVRNEQWADAIRDLTRAIRFDPTDALSHRARGWAYEMTGNMTNAIADYTEAVRLGPDDVSNYMARGEAYDRQKRWDDALEDFDKAAQLRPSDDGPCVGRGYTCLKQGNLDRAIDAFTEAIRLNRVNYAAYGGRGQALSQRGDWENAIKDTKEALRLNPDDDFGYNNLAWILATAPLESVRDGREAVRLAAKACELSKWKRSDCIDTLAAAYAETGDFDAAVKYQEQALATMEGIEEKELELARQRLELYRQHKPYREEPPPVKK